VDVPPVAEIAVIIWTDSAMYGTEQMDRAEAEKCRPTCGVSAGIIVSEGDDYITLALDHFRGEDFRCVNSYNKAQIHQIIRKSVETVGGGDTVAKKAKKSKGKCSK